MSKLQTAQQMLKALRMFTENLTEEQAQQITEVYPKWSYPTDYKLNEIVGYGVNGVGDTQLYKCLQAHTSQEDWNPSVATSLWKAIGITPSGYPEWSQPVGSADAYNLGDIVSFENQLYISTIDANVWQPKVYGWDEYAE